MKNSFPLLAAALLCSMVNSPAQPPAPSAVGAPRSLNVGDLQLVFREGVDPAKLDELVADTRKRSSEMRAQGLKEELAKDPAKLKMPWLGSWINAALYQGDQVKEANALIRNQLKEISLTGGEEDAPSEETPNQDGKEGSGKALSANAQIMEVLNLGGFAVRMLAMFGRDGKYPGRLEADVESKLKVVAWKTVCEYLDPDGAWNKRMSEWIERKYEILPLKWGRMWGTENHDVRRKPWVYFALSALRKDPAYAGKSIGGHTVEEWFGLMGDFMKQYVEDRVLTGMWIEPGGHYAHITFDNMIDLYEAAPDPMVRQHAKMFLDLALIEDEQISVNGYRAGARSRTPAMGDTTGKFKNTVFGDKPGLLMSDYQAPPVAIVLRNAKGAVEPYHISNRVPGEDAPVKPEFARNSHLVSYAYRTPGYLLGSVLQDPNRNYNATSDQRRWSGLIFQSDEAVYPWPKEIFKTKDSGRSSKAFGGIQHDGAMVVQKLLKSDAVDRIDVVFTSNPKITERGGWIFAEAGSGYAAVRFVDPAQPSGEGKYQWSDVAKAAKGKPTGKIAAPERDFLPIVFQAGDPAQFGSFENFQKEVLNSKVTINANASELEYKPVGGPVITWNYKQDAEPLALPRVDGKTPDLQPALLYDSPFLKAKWEDPLIYAGAGPFRAVYDMKNRTVTESKK